MANKNQNRKVRPFRKPAYRRSIIKDLLISDDPFLDVIPQGDQEAVPALDSTQYPERMPCLHDVPERKRIPPREDHSDYYVPVPKGHRKIKCRCPSCGALLTIVPCIPCTLQPPT